MVTDICGRSLQFQRHDGNVVRTFLGSMTRYVFLVGVFCHINFKRVNIARLGKERLLGFFFLVVGSRINAKPRTAMTYFPIRAHPVRFHFLHRGQFTLVLYTRVFLLPSLHGMLSASCLGERGCKRCAALKRIVESHPRCPHTGLTFVRNTTAVPRASRIESEELDLWICEETMICSTKEVGIQYMKSIQILSLKFPFPSWRNCKQCKELPHYGTPFVA